MPAVKFLNMCARKESDVVYQISCFTNIATLCDILYPYIPSEESTLPSTALCPRYYMPVDTSHQTTGAENV